MKLPEAVKAAVRAARVAYIASASGVGQPHVAVSKAIELVDAQHVAFRGWFCPQTDDNVASNKRIAVAIWDPAAEHGYQLVGEVTGQTVTAVIDGWAGKSLDNSGMPQEQRRFVVRVDAILELKSGVHSDESIKA